MRFLIHPFSPKFRIGFGEERMAYLFCKEIRVYEAHCDPIGVVERFCISNNYFLSGSNLPSRDKALECPDSDSGNEH